MFRDSELYCIKQSGFALMFQRMKTEEECKKTRKDIKTWESMK